MYHIFLTGEMQVGKSTIIEKILACRPKLALGGFRTVTRREFDGGSGVYLLPAADIAAPCDEKNMVGRRFGQGKFIAFPQVFDKVGVPMLQNTDNCQLLLMDELGMMEQQATAFCAAVLQCLEGNIPVLGVIKPIKNPLLEAIRQHQRVKIFTVTAANRDLLSASLKKDFLSGV